MGKTQTDKPAPLAVAPSPAPARRIWPSAGGNFIRDKITGELRPRAPAPAPEKQE